MALTAVAPFTFPNIFQTTFTGTYTTPNTLMDAVGEGFAMVMFPPKAGNIHTITWYVNGSSTLSGTVRAGIYTVDATTGFPTASAFGGMVAGTLNGASLPGGASEVSISLGTDCVIGSSDLGTPIAVVVDLSARASGATNLRYVLPVRPEQSTFFPYGCLNTGSWAKVTNLGGPSCTVSVVLTYSDGSVAYVPFTNFLPTTTTIASTTEYAIKYVIPFTCRVIGAMTNVTGPNSIPDHQMVLYDSSSNVLGSITMDKDVAGTATGIGLSSALFSAPVTLTAGSTFRLAMKPTTATAITVNYVSFPSSLWAKQFLGPNAYGVLRFSSRSGAGAWSDNDTAALPFSLLIDQIDVSAGGGTLVSSGMSGGMRL